MVAWRHGLWTVRMLKCRPDSPRGGAPRVEHGSADPVVRESCQPWRMAQLITEPSMAEPQKRSNRARVLLTGSRPYLEQC
eukprot:6660697-Prymnesium_polylepis.1